MPWEGIMKAIDIYELIAGRSFDLVADGIIAAADEAEAKEVAVSAALDELERNGLADELVFGLVALEAWAASQWRRHHAMAA